MSHQPLRFILILYISVRLFLSLWAGLVTAVIPLPNEPNEALRPYLGAEILDEGSQGWLLGPWQRFDTQRYIRIAREGYQHEADSVFPPLYPLAIGGLGQLLGGRFLLAALLISNGTLLGLLVVFQRFMAAQGQTAVANRTLVYFVLFPTGFFLFAGYSESLFILLAIGALWQGQNGRFWLAASLAFLAALTRLNGWLLIVPLAYQLWQQRAVQSKVTIAALGLPLAAPASFLLYRAWLGLPPIGTVYTEHWYQAVGFPGIDVGTAVRTLFFSGTARAGEFTLLFDFLVLILLLLATIISYRQLGTTFGLYMTVMLIFILLPTSDVKPLYSFSRYALFFFPLFMLLGTWSEKRPFLHRLILYPSLLLFLYFSAQFFLWGWVA